MRRRVLQEKIKKAILRKSRLLYCSKKKKNTPYHTILLQSDSGNISHFNGVCLSPAHAHTRTIHYPLISPSSPLLSPASAISLAPFSGGVTRRNEEKQHQENV